MRSRPFIFLNMVASLDGRINPPDRKIRLLSSDADRKNMDRLRASADAILIGSKTFCEPNAYVTLRNKKLQKDRTSSGLSVNPIVVTLSKTGRYFLPSKLLKRGNFEKIIFLGSRAKPAIAKDLSCHAKVYLSKNQDVCLNEVCKILHKNHKINRLLVEGGPKLNAGLFNKNLIDEIHLTIAPILLGGQGAKNIIDKIEISSKYLQRLKLADAHTVGNDLFLVYEIRPTNDKRRKNA